MTTQITQATASDLGTVSAILAEAAEWLLSIGDTFWLGDEVTEDRIRDDINAGSFFIARVRATNSSSMNGSHSYMTSMLTLKPMPENE